MLAARGHASARARPRGPRARDGCRVRGEDHTLVAREEVLRNKTAENLPLFNQMQDGFVASALLGTKGQQLFVLKGLLWLNTMAW
mgnify:CR=1 FL=1